MLIGVVRKAVSIATCGVSGRVLGNDAKKQRAAKGTKARGRPQKRASAGRPKRQTARRSAPRAARAPERNAARSATHGADRRAKSRAAPPSQTAHADTALQADLSGESPVDQLERLAILHRQGALSSEELAAAKAKILGASRTSGESAASPAVFPAIEAHVAAARHLAELAGHASAAPGPTFARRRA